jgi:uncharacterized Ntn-hydrolase superfamily protein
MPPRGGNVTRFTTKIALMAPIPAATISGQVLRAALTAAFLLVSHPVFATWSIVAVDFETGEVGAAAASCVGGVDRVLGLAPGNGAIVAQALPSGNARRQGVKMLNTGSSPRKVIDTISDPDFDANYMDRQYGVVALRPNQSAAAFTGSRNYECSGHLTGDGVAVQGNYLAGAEVVEVALSAFQDAESSGEPLADRLLAGLKAGSEVGGDRRCGLQRALSAFLVVAKPKDQPSSPSIHIIIPEQSKGGSNPVELLEETYRQSR